MPNFPNDGELLAFFAVEPKGLALGQDWFASSLEFTVIHGEEILVCKILQSAGAVSIRWTNGERELVSAHFDGIENAFILETNSEILVMRTAEKHPLEVWLQVYPRIRIEWRRSTCQ